MTDPPLEPFNEQEHVATMELREEILTIEKLRQRIGQVEVRRERRMRTETVTIEVVTEVLVLTAAPGSSGVMVDGVPLAAGEVREIVLFQEEARPGKEVVVTQNVDISKVRHVETTAQTVELAYEELVVDERPEPAS